MSVAVRTAVLRVPVARPRSLPRADDPMSTSPDALSLLVVQVNEGLGFAPVAGSGRAAAALVEDALAPLLEATGVSLIHQYHSRVRRRLPEVCRGGLGAAALAAVDVALWDFKAKAAGLPLYRLLGGCRESVVAHFAETAWPGLSSDQVIEWGRSAITDGMHGLRVGIGSRDPVADAQKLQRVRDDLGDDVWFGVTGGQMFDVPTALAFGRFLEEELDADLFEDPLPQSDIDGYARLAQSLELPLGTGAKGGVDGFAPLAARTAVSVFRLDYSQVGGITPALDVIALAASFHRSVIPCGMPAVDLHLACARPSVTAVEYTRWWEAVFEGAPTHGGDGCLSPTCAAGHGLTLRSGALKEFDAA